MEMEVAKSVKQESRHFSDVKFKNSNYDNSVSKLKATTLQGAIDELKSLIDALSATEE